MVCWEETIQVDFGNNVGIIRIDSGRIFLGNYEGQRRSENPFYNSVILANLTQINQFKASFGLPAEQLNVNRQSDYDHLLVKLDHSFNDNQYVFSATFSTTAA